jgi:arachidonate 15-lipoxygenase
LRPHFEGTFAINQAARNYLVMPGGPTDRLLCGTIEASRWLAAHGVQTWPFEQARPADTFRARGVLEASALPAYPYRDDVLLYWSVLRQWSESYVSLYYPRQSDLADDHELANWAREIGSANGGRIPGFAPQGELTLEWLIDTVAQILFTASVQHAAVGYPQFDLMSYIPNMPLAGYRPAPTSRSGSTEQDFLDLLPPLEMANLQLAVMYELGTIQYTRLGEYAPRHFRDPRVAPLLDNLQGNLDVAGLVIEERNRNRRPYEFLSREGIPQSINI